ncbi:MAG: radical SAM protein [Clostridia bacterium]|nr:radical SAM protein [Clostridia bacterium]
MRVLLVRPKPRNLFARLKTVRFEPLELEYLAAIVNELGFQYKIYDGMVEKQAFPRLVKSYRPHVVAITGYSIHVNLIKEYAETVKAFDPEIKVVVGGIHAELNWQDFYDPNIDIIVHSNPLHAFRDVLLNVDTAANWHEVKNICFKEKGRWVKNGGQELDVNALPFPDRTHLQKYKEQFRYFGKEECALVKTAWGCPYNCNFCYCGCLNGGKHEARDINKVVEEIEEMEQEKIFIIDDDFLVDRSRLLNFCRLITEKKIKKDFSIYGRADLICANRDILAQLRAAGVSEIIVGLEAVDDETLNYYHKKTSSEVNFRAVECLKENDIKSCGLFIVNEDFDLDDFKRLRAAVKKMELDLCMFSIFTPLKGVPGYENYREKLIVPEDKYENNDFLHLNIKPAKMGICRYYFEFYKLYFMAYTDLRRLRLNIKPIMKSLFNLLVETVKLK